VRRLLPTRNGTRRLPGLPALADTSVAKAVALRLAALDEQDGCDCSDGVRPGRSPQQARHAGRQGRRKHGMGDGIDGDSSAFVDNVPHDTLGAMRRKRSKDGRVLESIAGWWHAGSLDGKERVCPDKGSPHGSVLSPR